MSDQRRVPPWASALRMLGATFFGGSVGVGLVGLAQGIIAAQVFGVQLAVLACAVWLRAESHIQDMQDRP